MAGNTVIPEREMRRVDVPVADGVTTVRVELVYPYQTWTTTPDEREVELWDYLMVIWAWKRFVLGLTVLLSACVMLFFGKRPAQYTALASVASPDIYQGEDFRGAGPNNTLYLQFLSSYKAMEDVLNSPANLNVGGRTIAAIQDFFRGESFSGKIETLGAATTVSVGKYGTVKVAVTTPDPQLSSVIANAYINQLQRAIEGIPERTLARLNSLAVKKDALAKEVWRAQTALDAFEAGNWNIMAPGAKQPAMLMAERRLQTQRSTLQAAVQEKAAALQEVAKELEKEQQAVAGKAQTLRVIDWARPDLCSVSGANPKQRYALIIAAPLGLSIFLAFFCEYVHKRRQA